MGQCCGKPAGDDSDACKVHEELLTSLSFVQGLKVLPSLAVLDSARADGCERIYAHTCCRGSLFAACLFVGIGPAGPAAIRLIRGSVEEWWQEANVKQPDVALKRLFGSVDVMLAANGKGIKLKPWAMGVALLADLRHKTVSVASVGGCHAALCHVTGSFSQAASTGVPLTEAEHLRPLIAALTAAPQDPSAQAAAQGHVLGLRAAPTSTTTTSTSSSGGGGGVGASQRGTPAGGGAQQQVAGGEGSSRGGGAPQPQQQSGGSGGGGGGPLELQVKVTCQSLTAPSPALILMTDALAAALSVPDLASLGQHFNPTHVQLLRDAAAVDPMAAKALRPPVMQRGATKQQQQRAATLSRGPSPSASPCKGTKPPGGGMGQGAGVVGGSAEQRKPLVAGHGVGVVVGGPEQRNEQRKSESLHGTGGLPQRAAVFSPRAHDSPAATARPTVGTNQANRKGVATTGSNASPSTKHATAASPNKPALNSPHRPGQNSNQRAQPVAAAAAASSPAGKQGTPKRAPPAGATAAAGPLVAVAAPAAAGGPRFNLARLVLHHALAQPEVLRLRLTRGRGAWRRNVLAAAAAAGIPPPLPPAPTPTAAPAPAGAGRKAPAAAAAAATRAGSQGAPAGATGGVQQQQRVAAGGAAGPAAGVCAGVLVLTLQWPLSVTSQQVALMRGVAAARAENPRVEYWWHMVRQLVRHMHASRRRVQRSWDVTLSLVRASLLQQKRAAEVLAWKHLGEAVMVSRGGNVMRSNPGAAPADTASPLRHTSARPSREDVEGGSGGVAGTTSVDDVKPRLGAPPLPPTGVGRQPWRVRGNTNNTGHASPLDTPPRTTGSRQASTSGVSYTATASPLHSMGGSSSSAAAAVAPTAHQPDPSSASERTLPVMDASTTQAEPAAAEVVGEPGQGESKVEEAASPRLKAAVQGGDAAGGVEAVAGLLAAAHLQSGDACVVVLSPRGNTTAPRQARATADAVPQLAKQAAPHVASSDGTPPAGGEGGGSGAAKAAGQVNSRRAAAAAAINLRASRRTAG